MSSAEKPPAYGEVLPTPGNSCSSSSTSVSDDNVFLQLDDDTVPIRDVVLNLPAVDVAMLRRIGSSTARRRDVLTHLLALRQSPEATCHIATAFSESYAAVIRHKAQHDAFLTALRSVDCDAFENIVASVTAVIKANWPGAKPTVGSASWLMNLSSLLAAVANEVRAAASSTQRGADAFARFSPQFVEAVVERFAEDIDSSMPIVTMLATRAYASCLAQLLRLAALVDAASLSEATTIRLNACFAKFTDVLGEVVVDPIGVEVVIAMVDDLARGLKARRHIMDNFATFSLHASAKKAVIAVVEHSGKVSKALGSALLLPAPSTLVEVVLANAEGISEATPTIIALACHSEGSAVVVAVLPHLDGYYAVAIADALHQWANELSTCSVPEVASVVAWATAHPGFDAAVIGVHGKLARDLIIKKRDIVSTAASRNIDAAIANAAPLTPPPHKVSGKICFHFHTGDCPQGSKCNMLHVAQDVVSQLSNRDCCWFHGEPTFREEHSGISPFIDKPFSIVDSSHHSRRFELTGAQLSFTAGLAVYLARDYDVGLPIETDSLCRQHHRCSCHKPQQCKYVHVCRQLFTLIQETAASAAAVPAPQQMPSTPLLRNSELKRPFETHVSVERKFGGSCASTASGELGRARQESATASTGFSDLSESPIALAMSTRRRHSHNVDTTPGAPRAVLWKLGPGHGTPSINSTTDQSAHTGRGSLI